MGVKRFEKSGSPGVTGSGADFRRRNGRGDRFVVVLQQSIFQLTRGATGSHRSQCAGTGRAVNPGRVIEESVGIGGAKFPAGQIRLAVGGIDQQAARTAVQDRAMALMVKSRRERSS